MPWTHYSNKTKNSCQYKCLIHYIIFTSGCQVVEHFFFVSLLCVPLLGKGLRVLLPNLSILRDICPCLPSEHDQIVTPSAPWSTSTAISSLRRPVGDDLCPPLGVHTCDMACPLPLQLGCCGCYEKLNYQRSRSLASTCFSRILPVVDF